MITSRATLASPSALRTTTSKNSSPFPPERSRKAALRGFFAFGANSPSRLRRQPPQRGSLSHRQSSRRRCKASGFARASLNEKDFPRPGEDVTQVTKRGAVANPQGLTEGVRPAPGLFCVWGQLPKITAEFGRYAC